MDDLCGSPVYPAKPPLAPVADNSSTTMTDATAAATGVGTKQPTTYADATLQDEQNEIVLTSKGGAVKSWKVKSKGQEVDLVQYPGCKYFAADVLSRSRQF